MTALELIDLPIESPRWVSALPVLQELRPHLTRAGLEHVLHAGAEQGPWFLGAFTDGVCLGIAGFRLIINTSAGRKLYVDDLVVTAAQRSHGVGSHLLSELTMRARGLGCAQIDLDSGVQRFDAHRFYLAHGFQIRSHHFALRL